MHSYYHHQPYPAGQSVSSHTPHLHFEAAALVRCMVFANNFLAVLTSLRIRRPLPGHCPTLPMAESELLPMLQGRTPLLVLLQMAAVADVWVDSWWDDGWGAMRTGPWGGC